MKLRLFVILLLLASAYALADKPPAAQAPPSFGEAVDVNVVNIDIYATDKSGNRVTDLRKGDFQLFEDGKPVEISNFEAVNGRPPAAATPSPAAGSNEDAWNLVVFFDNFNLNPGSRDRAVRQLREFLGREILPTDRVALVTQDLSLNIRFPFSGDQAGLVRTLDEIHHLSVHGPEIDRQRKQAVDVMVSIQQGGSVEPVGPKPCPLNIAVPAHSFAASRQQEVLRAIGGLTTMVNSLSGVPGRKAVLHISDGLPLRPGEELFQFLVALCGGGTVYGSAEDEGTGTHALLNRAESSRRASANVTPPPSGINQNVIGAAAYEAAWQGPIDAQSYSVIKELQALAAHANAQRVTLYTLQASGLQAPGASQATLGPEDRLFRFPAVGTSLRLNHRDSLQLLADETGGRSILDANDFLPDLDRMLQDFESYYSLGFTPAHNGDGREHRIEVKVKRAGVGLRYRQSYRDKPALEKTFDRTLAALLYGFEDNPLQITVEVGEQTPGPAGSFNVPVHLRIPLWKLAILNRETLYEGNLRLMVASRSEDGRSSPVRQIQVPLQIPRKQVLNAMGQFYIYTLTLQLPPGEQRVAVAVRDELAATTSYLSRAVTVNTTAAAVAQP